MKITIYFYIIIDKYFLKKMLRIIVALNINKI